MLRQFTYGAVRAMGNLCVAGFMVFTPAAHAAERVDILALGDSLTQGYGLLEQDGFVPRLREWMAEHGHDVRIVNGGVSGDTTAGGLARVEWSLSDDIDAMIVTLGGNDLLRGIDPQVARGNLTGILEAAKARGVVVMLVGMEAPGNYGPDYKAQFDAIYPELAQSYDAVFAPAFFEGITDGNKTPAEVTGFMQPDGIHPNPEGVKLIVEALGPKVEELVRRVEN